MYIIGIDGGGTKTKGYISDNKGNILASATGMSSNYLSAGKTKTKESLNNVITTLCKKSNTTIDEIEIISLGLAGAGRAKDREMIKNIIKEIGINGHIIINDDAYISLIGAHGKSKGIITISGTGSISLGLNSSGEKYRTGGWGHILGDEGSGYYFAREGLMAIVKSYDGRGRHTKIQDKILNYLKLPSIDELIQYVYNNRDSKDKLSCLSKLVIEAAEENDEIAVQIIKKGIYELIEMTTVLTNKLDEPLDVALAGGTFENSKYMREMFIRELSKTNSELRVIDNKFNSGIGAVMIGWQYLGIDVDESTLMKNVRRVDANV